MPSKDFGRSFETGSSAVLSFAGSIPSVHSLLTFVARNES